MELLPGDLIWRKSDVDNYPPDVPAIIICPQCPSGTEWKKYPIHKYVISLLDVVIEEGVGEFTVDANKVYLTGISMGGLGAWMIGAQYEDRFAAVVPICGGGPPVYAPLLKNMPMWFFHSADDNVIGVEETDRLVDALRQQGNKSVLYTRYECSTESSSCKWMIGHNCWDKAYTSAAFWNWLFHQKRLLDVVSGSGVES